ncbi:MAG TPA: ABC transporter permease [Actinomycetota bacterium]|nr:ABC transporter permease [Actinomycetota bacterium]
MSDQERAPSPVDTDDRAAVQEEVVPTGGAIVAPTGESRWRALLVPALAILTALIIGGLIIVFSDPDVLEQWTFFFSDPLTALRASWEAVFHAYQALLTGSLGSPAAMWTAVSTGEGLVSAFRPLSETVVAATPLILTGLSVAIGFRAGLFNIGAEGQLIVGAIFAGFVGFTLTGLPTVVHLPLAILAGFLGGAVWGFVPGFLRARTGAHEVIITIMLNQVALRLLDYLLRNPAFQRPGRTDPISKPVETTAQLPHLLGSSLRIHAGIILALVMAWVVWWLLFRTTRGFEFRAVGANPDAARYAGISVPATYIVVMTLAGGLAGLAGASQLLGGVTLYSLTPGFAGGLGFDAIALALVGRAHPGGIVAAAFMFGILRAGATKMQAVTSTPVDIIVVIQALVIVFIAAPALVRAIYRIRARRQVGAEVFTKGWGA